MCSVIQTDPAWMSRWRRTRPPPPTPPRSSGSPGCSPTSTACSSGSSCSSSGSWPVASGGARSSTSCRRRRRRGRRGVSPVGRGRRAGDGIRTAVHVGHPPAAARPATCPRRCGTRSTAPTSWCTPATGSTSPPSTGSRRAAARCWPAGATTTAPSCAPGCPRSPGRPSAGCGSPWCTRRGARSAASERMRAAYPDTDLLVFGHSHIPWDTTIPGSGCSTPGRRPTGAASRTAPG